MTQQGALNKWQMPDTLQLLNQAKLMCWTDPLRRSTFKNYRPSRDSGEWTDLDTAVCNVGLGTAHTPPERQEDTCALEPSPCGLAAPEHANLQQTYVPRKFTISWSNMYRRYLLSVQTRTNDRPGRAHGRQYALTRTLVHRRLHETLTVLIFETRGHVVERRVDDAALGLMPQSVGGRHIAFVRADRPAGRLEQDPPPFVSASWGRSSDVRFRQLSDRLFPG